MPHTYVCTYCVDSFVYVARRVEFRQSDHAAKCELSRKTKTQMQMCLLCKIDIFGYVHKADR